MSFWTYILYSRTLDKFYIGETTQCPNNRLKQHNEDYYNNKFTRMGKPWKIFLTIECETHLQAIKIERKIKAMKSKKYIENLVKYPEMIQKLLSQYK